MSPLPFGSMDNWTFMRCPPPPSVPSQEQKKNIYKQSAAMYPGAIGQLLRAGGIVLSLNAFFALSSLLSLPLPHTFESAAAFTPPKRLKACPACMRACLIRAQILSFPSSEVSGKWTKWIEFETVRQAALWLWASNRWAGIHAMSRNSCNNRSRGELEANRKTVLFFYLKFWTEYRNSGDTPTTKPCPAGKPQSRALKACIKHGFFFWGCAKQRHAWLTGVGVTTAATRLVKIQMHARACMATDPVLMAPYLLHLSWEENLCHTASSRRY